MAATWWRSTAVVWLAVFLAGLAYGAFLHVLWGGEPLWGWDRRPEWFVEWMDDTFYPHEPSGSPGLVVLAKMLSFSLFWLVMLVVLAGGLSWMALRRMSAAGRGAPGCIVVMGLVLVGAVLGFRPWDP